MLELKEKIKEFAKRYFTYSQQDKKLSDSLKEELQKLGAHKPWLTDDENQRSILLMNLWGSEKEEVRNRLLHEAQAYFSLEKSQVEEILNDIWEKITKRRQMAKNARKKKAIKENEDDLPIEIILVEGKDDYLQKCFYCSKSPNWINRKMKHSVCHGHWNKAPKGNYYEKVNSHI